MAKEKNKVSASLAEVSKKYGDIVSFGSALLNKKRSIIPVSPSLDLVLHGGIPEGSWVGLAGPPGCGKSTTALQIVKNALDIPYEGEKRKVFYFDVENRLKPMNLAGIAGLNSDDIIIIRSTEERMLTAQDILDICESLVKSPENKGCIVVIDSSSALCPADEMVAGTSGTIRTTQPKLMSHFCKKMAGPVQVMDATIILIQHLITNTSGYGEKWLVDGGEKMKYQLDVWLMTKGKPELWEYKGKPVGQVVEWKVLKSALGHPHIEARSFLRYGSGLDSLKEHLTLAIDLGVVVKAGAWFSFGDFKCQGEENLYVSVQSNESLRNEIIAAVKGLIS
jgi:recombination protein RecA